MKALADCGIDFIASGSGDRGLLDLLDKYGVGNFVGGIVPGWYGGDGSNAGMMEVYNPISSYEASYANFEDHPAIWGICVGDEPSSFDFAHYGKVVDKVNELFTEQFAYLNLYPNTGKDQLGVAAIEYYKKYVENVETDYICFDHYPISALKKDNRKSKIQSFVINLRQVYEACLESDRDLWIVIQSSSHDEVYAVNPEYTLSEEDLRLQSSIALAFGAKALSWACWNSGWYYNHAVDGSGNLTPVYYRLQTINSEIKNLSPVYSRYSSKAISRLGKTYFAVPKFEEVEQSVITNLSIDEDSTVLIGFFEKNDGNGNAFMVSNISDYMCSGTAAPTVVEFTVADASAKVTAYHNGSVVELNELGNGSFSVELENTDNLFVTVE